MIKNKEEYDSLLKSGMFFEFHLELTGEWEKDKFEVLTNNIERDSLKVLIDDVVAQQEKLREQFNNFVEYEQTLLKQYAKLSDNVSRYEETEEDYYISKRPKKVEKRTYGRMKFMQQFKDEDTGEAIEIERSVVVNNNGKWIYPQIRSIIYHGFEQ